MLKAVITCGKECPACGQFIEKNAGCHVMMCGTHAHGDMATVLRLGTGCGHEFDWNTMAPLRNGTPGHPANDKQVRFRPGYDPTNGAGPPAADTTCTNMLQIGSIVAFHSEAHNRFLSLQGDSAQA